MGGILDLVGQKFGRLIVIKRVEDKIYGKGKNKFSQWLCQCECGNEIVVLGSNLQIGHTKSCGCYKKEVIEERNKIALKDVQNEFIKVGLIPLFDIYKNNRQKLLAQTKEGYKVVLKLSNITSGRRWRVFDISNPYTIENIKLWLKLNKKSFELISDKYESSKTDLQFKCLKKKCGEIFYANLSEIKIINNCPCCVSKQIGISNCLATKNPKLAKEWHPNLNGDLTPYNVASNANKKVWWLCDKNHKWESFIINRNRKDYGCPICYEEIRGIKKSTPKFKKDSLLKDNPKLCKEWNYKKNDKGPECYYPKSHKKVHWKCRDCGYEWESRISERNKKKGNGCPKCSRSCGEIIIEKWLDSRNILFRNQYRFEDCRNIKPLPFDFYLINYNICIEYDSELHFMSKKYFGGEEEFKKRQYKDQIKNNYCILNDIKLYRIPYWEFNNIETILNNIINNQDYNEFLINNINIVNVS